MSTVGCVTSVALLGCHGLCMCVWGACMCVWFQAIHPHVTRSPKTAQSTTFNSISSMHNWCLSGRVFVFTLELKASGVSYRIWGDSGREGCTDSTPFSNHCYIENKVLFSNHCCIRSVIVNLIFNTWKGQRPGHSMRLITFDDVSMKHSCILRLR